MASELAVPFYEVLEESDGIIHELAAKGNRLIGYFCTYTPVEVIHASGFIPVRIFGKAERIEKAYTLTPSFICPYLRRAVEKGLNGVYRCLTGIVQGYTCDVSCGLINIWEENIAGEIFHLLPLPYFDQPEGRSFLKSGLEELVRKLECAGGEFSEKRLEQSLDLYAQIRTLMAEIYGLRYNRLLPLTAAELLAVVQAGFILPPEDYYSMLQELRRAMPDVPAPHSRIPVLVSGSLIEDGSVLDILEEAGGMVVADDLCTGIRNFDPADGIGSDPFSRIIHRIMHRFPCPARSSAEIRLPRIIELVQRSRAEAVVFIFQKFCTPHLADHPYLRSMLKEMHIPSTMVEMEESGIADGIMRTRFESFFEMLKR